MKKIKTGILGLDDLLDGGFNEHSASILVGSAGTGKTTMALQFIRKGLELGNEAIYITLEESKEQIMAEARSMGWEDIGAYVENSSLVFLEAAGKDLADFIKEEMPEFVDDWKGSSARIAIDPLTPVIWAFDDKYEQRMLISQLFKETKKVGTVLSTIEEYSGEGGEETVIPMYLADNIVRIFTVPGTGNRMMNVLKTRQSWHSEVTYPYRFVLGIGIVVDTSELDGKRVKKLTPDLKLAINNAVANLPKRDAEQIKNVIKYLERADLGDMEPEQIVNMLIEDYKSEERVLDEPRVAS
ncbi:putative RecA-superfamily ATPases implicated in signal transduction [Methanocella conradii HZ254]|uniref:RecA-superfamily ATPases implicated in signal transduction n=1 Tax=Methanocella conradii (strain DSM 24694 / JCM 17849 / CGMCC 1.5162 / HZ254) TaxID=1041930 RepID=H8I8T1_METCZ|nr:ATPase domain-containing protein [Methanocella conradii]AFC99985.1 putative RecA-superfamily ATPases implicated in signal transduction [Methanocella conradii HZ254]MDI6897330.1 ATPase domain-containing protein [Methanocella conradii]